MKLSRRGVLALFAAGSAGAALAVAGGLSYRYYSRVKWRPAISRPARRSAEEEWLLSEEDIEAFARSDALVESDDLTLLDNTDLPGGGDFRATRVSGLEECVTACEQDSRCQAFTYARSTHLQPDKRQMCWLKENMPEKTVTDQSSYVSGRR